MAERNQRQEIDSQDNQCFNRRRSSYMTKYLYDKRHWKWDEMQKNLDKFSRLNPKAYMVLLD